MIIRDKFKKISLPTPTSILASSIFVLFCLFGMWIWVYAIAIYLFILSNSLRLERNTILKLLPLVTLLIVSFFIGLPTEDLVTNEYLINNSNDIYQRYRTTDYQRYRNFILIVVYVILFLPLGCLIQKKMDRNIPLYWLYLLLSIVLLQYFLHEFFALRTDFALGGVTSRSSLNGYFRPTAFYFEPNNLATVAFYIGVFLFSKSRLDFYSLSIIFTIIFISKSLTGLGLFLILLTLFLWIDVRAQGKSKLVLFFLLLTILCIGFVFVSDNFISERLIINRDLSLFYRLTSILKFSNYEIPRMLLGSGISNNDCGCLLTDTPFFWIMLYLMGLGPGLIFLSVLFIGITDRSKIATILLFLIPGPIFQPIIWFWLGTVVSYRER